MLPESVSTTKAFTLVSLGRSSATSPAKQTSSISTLSSAAAHDAQRPSQAPKWNKEVREQCGIAPATPRLFPGFVHGKAIL
jgi:hypothetical protein